MVEKKQNDCKLKITIFYGNPSTADIQCGFLKAGLLDFYSYYDLAPFRRMKLLSTSNTMEYILDTHTHIYIIIITVFTPSEKYPLVKGSEKHL